MTKNDVFQALIENHEGVTEDSDGSRFGEVYLPNIGSSHQIAGFLSVLAKEGLYRPVSKLFGDVRLK